jgi:hypothetical protein
MLSIPVMEVEQRMEKKLDEKINDFQTVVTKQPNPLLILRYPFGLSSPE